MSANGSSTAIMSPRDSLSSSQLLSSSISSLSNSTSSRPSSSQISKIYRQASTLFLTRRLPESLSTILPVITSPSTDADVNGNSVSAGLAPVATASRTTRIKVWSLYLTILNAIVELDSDEGKQAFGSQEWRNLVAKVRDGQVWEEVVQNGYRGVEGDVDSDVVINLATLLLAHARTQHLNQQRLENYLAASTQPNLDISNRLSASQDPRQSRRGVSPSKSGTDTPRDLNARVKILELYTLHVLLRNNEWEYAREFITISEVLDDERREAFLSALQSLEEEQAENATREAEAQQQQEEQLQRDLEEARQRRIEAEEQEAQEVRRQAELRRSPPKRASSEVDYGIDDSHSVTYSTRDNASTAGSTAGGAAKPKPKAKPASKSARNGNVNSVSAQGKKTTVPARAAPPPNMLQRASAFVLNLRKLLESMAVNFRTNPLLLLRLLAFIVVVVLAFSKQSVRARVRRMWDKIRRTAGMGVKVSYI